MRAGSGLRSIVANASYSVISKALNIGLRLTYVLALARLLGSADYGLFVYALSWYVLFMPLTNLGQDLVLARAIGGRAPDAANVVSNTFTLRVYAILAVFTMVAALGWFANPGEQGRLLVLLVSLAMIPRALWMWCQTVFIAAEQSRFVLQQDLLFRPLEVLVALTVLLGGGDLLMVALVHTGSWILQALSGLLLVRRRLFRVCLRPAIADWRPMVADGLKIGVSRVMEGWLLSGPVVLFRHLSQDLEALGLLALCVQVLNVLRILPGALAAAAMPVLGRAMRSDGGQIERFLRVLGLCAASLGLVLAAVTSLAGTELVALTAGGSFVPVAQYLPALCWLAILPVMGAAAQRVGGLRGYTSNVLWSNLLGGLVMTVLGVLLVPRAGIAGALLGTLLGSLLSILGMSTRMAGASRGYAGLALGAALAAGISLWSIGADGVTDPAWPRFVTAALTCLAPALFGWWLDRWARPI